MNLETIKQKLMPPALAWRLNRARREREELGKFKDLYGTFAKPGDLCFDIGANLGNRVRCFRGLGCRVVAVEPQPSCQQSLARKFGADQEVTLVAAAVAATPGRLDLRISPDHVLSSMSDEFIRKTSESGRFKASVWNRVESVDCTTLDLLIESHGMPAFVKIDVEGYEAEVLAGLSRPVAALSIEWVPEMPENAHKCVDHLETLGRYEYQVSWAETMRLSARGWRDAAAIRRLIDEFAGETFLFGDIYARQLPQP
jgi:FkbM family methyltransferase